MSNRSTLAILLFSLILSVSARAEPMTATYSFFGTSAQQPWANGAVLTVNFDGTVQADNDTVTINSISSATLSRTGLADYDFPSVEAGEIETTPPGGTPVVSFSGTTVNFSVCPSGFTEDSDGDGVFDSCDHEVDGGFGMNYGLSPSAGDMAHAAAGVAAATCNVVSGCPVSDAPIDLASWLLEGDADADGFADTADNCPDIGNFQIDSDGDGAGNACEIGDMQSFSDNSRPILTPTYNGIPTSCAMNGWLVFDCAAAIVQGEGGTGDYALHFDPSNAHNSHFNFLTWDEYPHADTRFLGDYLDAEVTELRFRARHAGGSEDLVLRVMVTDSFNDGGSDFAISTEAAVIAVGSGWQEYTISLDQDDLELGTRLFGDRTPGPPRRTSDEILAAVAQFSLRHDPTFAGPGTPAPTDSTMDIDDIELVGGGSTGLLSLLVLMLFAYRRSSSLSVPLRQ